MSEPSVVGFYLPDVTTMTCDQALEEVARIRRQLDRGMYHPLPAQTEAEWRASLDFIERDILQHLQYLPPS
jgi:hypothetical protein